MNLIPTKLRGIFTRARKLAYSDEKGNVRAEGDLVERSAFIYVVSPLALGRHATALIWLFKLLNDGGLSNQERERYRHHLPYMLFRTLNHCLRGHMTDEELSNLGAAHAAKAEIVMQEAERHDLKHQVRPPETVLDAVGELWEDPGVQRSLRMCCGREALQYFNSSIDHILSFSYQPTSSDTLYARLLTNANPYSAFDMRLSTHGRTYALLSSAVSHGYHRRAKLKSWLYGCDAVIFIADLCDYDQVTLEGNPEAPNRLRNIMDYYFEPFANSSWLDEVGIILLFNNAHEFTQKLKVSPLANSFPDFQGGNDEMLAKDFILKEFISRKKRDDREIYAHFLENIEDESSWNFTIAALDDIVRQKEIGSVLSRETTQSVASINLKPE